MLPALNDLQGNAAWLEAWRETRRDVLTAPESELLGNAAAALRSNHLDRIALHNGLHTLATNPGFAPAEQSQLCNAARLLWGLAHGVTPARLAAISSRPA